MLKEYKEQELIIVKSIKELTELDDLGNKATLVIDMAMDLTEHLPEVLTKLGTDKFVYQYSFDNYDYMALMVDKGYDVIDPVVIKWTDWSTDDFGIEFKLAK